MNFFDLFNIFAAWAQGRQRGAADHTVLTAINRWTGGGPPLLLWSAIWRTIRCAHVLPSISAGNCPGSAWLSPTAALGWWLRFHSELQCTFAISSSPCWPLLPWLGGSRMLSSVQELLHLSWVKSRDWGLKFCLPIFVFAVPVIRFSCSGCSRLFDSCLTLPPVSASDKSVFHILPCAHPRFTVSLLIKTGKKQKTKSDLREIYTDLHAVCWEWAERWL